MSQYVPYRPHAIANYFLAKGEECGDPITPMKVLKLVYYAHGWHLALFDEPLIDESVEAWSYGPVVHSLYDSVKQFGRFPIEGPVYPRRPSVTIGRRPVATDVDPNDVRTQALLDRIWEVYGGLTGPALSNMTHAPGTPWAHLYEKHGGRFQRGQDLPDDLIKDHFKKLRGTNQERHLAPAVS